MLVKLCTGSLGDCKGTKFCIATDRPHKIPRIATMSEYLNLNTLGEYLQLVDCFSHAYHIS